MLEILIAARMICSRFLKVYILWGASHQKTCRTLRNALIICISLTIESEKIFTIRWVILSFKAVSAVEYYFPVFALHFFKASKDETRQGLEKAGFLELPPKICTITFGSSCSGSYFVPESKINRR